MLAVRCGGGDATSLTGAGVGGRMGGGAGGFAIDSRNAARAASAPDDAAGREDAIGAAAVGATAPDGLAIGAVACTA